jgi:hypothetical protein
MDADISHDLVTLQKKISRVTHKKNSFLALNKELISRIDSTMINLKENLILK